MKSKFIMRLLSVIGILFTTPIFAETITDKGIKALKEKAEQGDIEAQYLIYAPYCPGDDIEKNPQTTAIFTIHSAKLGNANAQYRAGLAYEYGFGVKQDNQKAIEWYTKAAKQGYSNTKHNLQALQKEMTAEEIAKAKKLTH